jgi:SAM-dependent methyltransferase
MEKPTPFSVICEVAGPPAGQRIADVGCGDGALAALLSAAGYSVVGVEPGAEALAAGRKRAPQIELHQAGAEKLPFANGSFDVVAMVNALHHVPPQLMLQAVAEAARVLRPGGSFVVIEPSVTGSFFEALRPIEDETEIRLLAQGALDAAVASGKWTTLKSFSFTREERFATTDDFVARAVAVDPARKAIAQANRPEVLDAFARNAVREADGLHLLQQPIIVRVLAPI